MKLSVAVIGSGKSALENHIPAYLGTRETQVVAIADADVERAQSVALKFGIKGVYDDYLAMLKRRRVELVSVCTAPSERKDAVVTALSRRAHVLCDMPMGMNSEEGEEMLRAAKKANRVLMFAAPRRYDPHAISIKQTIVNGDLGTVCFCRAWCGHKTIPAEDFWQIKAKEGGGALAVSGQEMLDLALWLTGDEPVSVSGRLFHRFAESPDIPKTWFGSRREIDAEDLAVAVVQCKKAVVFLEADWLAAADDSGILVAGTKGRGGTSPFKMEVATRGEYFDTTPTFFPETGVWKELVRSFLESSQGQRKAFPEANEVLLVQRVTDAIRKSSSCGTEVCVGSS
jgi:predicted dehydrogenase